MAENLFVAWQDGSSRRWHTIARLRRSVNGFELAFTKGVLTLRSIPEDLFRLDTGHTFRFNHLISLFTNKIPPRSRSDYDKIARWVGVAGGEDDFDLLGKFGLIPGTDGLLVYPEPTVSSGTISFGFFVHGMRHMHADVAKWCEEVSEGHRLLAMLDLQNPYDHDAIALRCHEKGDVIVGYVPAFYAATVKAALQGLEDPTEGQIEVVRYNADAPHQLKLFCRFMCRLRANAAMVQSDEHQLMGPSIGIFKGRPGQATSLGKSDMVGTHPA